MSVATDLVATLVVLVARVGLALVTSLALIAIGPALVGVTSTVVMSDSMSPGIRAGDVVLVRAVPAAELRLGQVLLVDDPAFPGRLRLHRLVAERSDGLVLKGDANAQQDPQRVQDRAVHGVGFLRVPWIGLPVLWLRTGQTGQVVLAGAILAAAAAAVVLLDPDPPRPGAAPRAVRRAIRRALRLRSGGAALVGLLVAAIAAASGTHSTWAVFTSATISPASSVQTGSFLCPALPSPAPNVAYSFTGASGTAEANRPDANGGSTYDATLSSASLRVGGTCVANASPSVRFTGTGEAVVGKVAIPFTTQGTMSLWFYPTQATGVLQDSGGTAGTDPNAADRQFYFTGGGKLAYAMHDGAGVTKCATTGAVTLGTWHFAAASYNSTSKTFVLYLDGTTNTCSSVVTTPSSASGYVRIGSDALFASDASANTYKGQIDEAYLFGSVLTPAQVDAVRTNGH